MTKFRWAAIIAFILVTFFSLRLVNLDAIPVFVDEAIYVRWSQVMKAEPQLRFLPLSDGKQPLFMWLTMPVLSIVNDPLLAGRLLSVSAGFMTMLGLSVLTYFLSRNFSAALITAFIYAITPYTVFFDRMALVDSMLAALSVWTLVFSYLFIKHQTLEYAMLVGFTVGFGLITKSPAIFFYLFPVLALVLYFPNKPKWSRLALGFLALLFISQFIYAILRLGPGFSQISSRNQDYLFSLPEVLSHPLNPLIGNLKWFGNWLFYLGTPLFIVFLILSLIKPALPQIYLLVAALLPLLVQSSFAKVYTSRYALFCFVPLIPLVSLSIYRYLSKFSFARLVILILGVIMSLVVSLSFYFFPQHTPMTTDMRSGYFNEWTAGYGNKDVANYLLAQSKIHDSVVVYTEGFFGTMPDGIQIYTQHEPRIKVVGIPPILVQLPLDIDAASAENEVYVLVNASRNQLPASQLERLELIKSYPKLPRLDGTQEFLQFYRYL